MPKSDNVHIKGPTAAIVNEIITHNSSHSQHVDPPPTCNKTFNATDQLHMPHMLCRLLADHKYMYIHCPILR